MISSISFAVIGIACIAFGILFIARRKARIFYGFNTEGSSAVVAGIFLIAVGIAVMIFGFFVFPRLFDFEGLRELVPELQ